MWKLTEEVPVYRERRSRLTMDLGFELVEKLRVVLGVSASLIVSLTEEATDTVSSLKLVIIFLLFLNSVLQLVMVILSISSREATLSKNRDPPLNFKNPIDRFSLIK